jgi:hypothetical protein
MPICQEERMATSELTRRRALALSNLAGFGAAAL